MMDRHGLPYSLRWGKYPKDDHGFPITPDGWWDVEVETKFGRVTRRTIIELLSERSNSCMDDYVYSSDEELRCDYENGWEYTVGEKLNPDVTWSQEGERFVAVDATYPGLSGKGETEDEAMEFLERAVLLTNDNRFEIR